MWETNYSRGMHILTFDREWRRAQPYYENAAAISPRTALVHTYFGMFLALAGSTEEAIAQAELGRQLDPLAPFSNTFAAVVFALLGRLEAGESAARQAIELQSDFLPGCANLTSAVLRGLARLRSRSCRPRCRRTQAALGA
jgi:Tfp pilus assembly protein PilF